MNGPSNHQSDEVKIKGMYKLKKAFEIPEDIPVVKCMYKVKPLYSTISSTSSADFDPLTNGEKHGTGPIKTALSPEGKKQTGTKTTISDQKMGKKNGPSSNASANSGAKISDTDSSVKSLEERQLEIIQKLERLRDVITEIHSSSLLSQDGGSIKRCTPPEFSDIVINADPRFPPFSLLFFKKLFAKFCGYNVSLTPHLHSSYKDALPNNLQIFNSPPTENKTDFNVSLIWKTVDHGCDLIVSPTNQTPIRGEANICRFFSRLLPVDCGLNYDTLDLDTLVRVEELVDHIVQGSFSLDYLENLKSGQPYLLGDLSLADLLYFSEATTLLLKSKKGLQSYPNIADWIRNCQDWSDLNLFNL